MRLAEAAGVTLIGFARGARHSVYSHPQRIH
ncbi:formate dehydrogenase accessory sulfurtransferase FdhD [Aromatoleum bremense]